MIQSLNSLGVSVAHAQTCVVGAICPTGAPPGSGSNISFTTFLTTLSSNLLQIALLVGGILAVFYLFYSGLLYITSAGNADKAKQGRAGIINAIIGIVVILSAYFIIRFAVGIGKEVNCADPANAAAADCRKTTFVGANQS